MLESFGAVFSPARTKSVWPSQVEGKLSNELNFRTGIARGDWSAFIL